MKQKAKKSIVQQPTISAKPAGTNAVQPCFHCGLIFARKDDFSHHMERYHQPKPQDGNGRCRCPECGETFGNDEKTFKEHLLFHDLAVVLAVLRRSEMSRKRLQPVVVRTTASFDTGPSKEQASPRTQETKAIAGVTDTAQFSEPSNSGKTKGRPRSRSVFVTPAKNSSSAVTVSVPPSPTTPELTRKRRRISNEPSLTESSAKPVSTLSPVLPPPPPPLPTSAPISTQELSPAKPWKALDQKSSPPAPVSSIPTQFAGITASPIPLQPPPSTSTLGPAKSSPPLQSACPNCNQNLGKPWHLMDHMIQHHDAQLLRLNRTLKKPEGSSGLTTIPQTFSERQCTFCQLNHADVQHCLLHVVRTHRSRLFECPDNGECILTCELMCAIGPDSAPKKFTISVKIKRKTSGE